MTRSADAENMTAASGPLVALAEAVENGVLTETIDRRTIVNTGIVNLVVRDLVTEEKGTKTLHGGRGESQMQAASPYRPGAISWATVVIALASCVTGEMGGIADLKKSGAVGADEVVETVGSLAAAVRTTGIGNAKAKSLECQKESGRDARSCHGDNTYRRTGYINLFRETDNSFLGRVL
jgi:hypothetical protein